MSAQDSSPAGPADEPEPIEALDFHGFTIKDLAGATGVETSKKPSKGLIMIGLTADQIAQIEATYSKVVPSPPPSGGSASPTTVQADQQTNPVEHKGAHGDQN